MKDRHNHIVLEFPKDIESIVGEGSLVIELEVDTRMEEGWKETVEFTEGPRYMQTPKERHWKTAEDHCRKWDGHLVSVHSEWEHQEINRIRPKTKDLYIWLGGTNQEDPKQWDCGGQCWGTAGAWQWTDGSPWDFRRWQDGIEGRVPGTQSCTSKASDNFGGGKLPCLAGCPNCGQQWRPLECLRKYTSPGICHKNTKKLSGNKTLRFEYNKKNLKDHVASNQHLVLHVWHKYEATSQHLLDSWREPRMTGFRLKWSLKDEKGNQKQFFENGKYKTEKEESWLRKMIQIARKTREEGKSREAILQLTLKEKMKQGWFLEEFESKCKRGHLRSENYKTVFNKIITGLNADNSEGTPTAEDTMTGYMMFATVIYCPESVIKLYRFINSVLASESQRTILQTTLNIIWSGEVKNTLYERKIDGFYVALERILKLDYGKILLATVSKTTLKMMIDSKMPFFSLFAEEVNQCHGACTTCSGKCLGLDAVVKTLGKEEIFFHHFSLFVSGEASENITRVIHSPHLISSQGQLLPSALIPFCALNSDLGVLGNPLNLTEKLRLPVCNKFLPVVLEGQLCYSIYLDQVKTSPSKENQTHGLTMILDLGLDTTEA